MWTYPDEKDIPVIENNNVFHTNLDFKKFREEGVVHPEVLRGPLVGFRCLTGVVLHLNVKVTGFTTQDKAQNGVIINSRGRS